MRADGVLESPAAVDALRCSIGATRALYEVRVRDGNADWESVSGSDAFDWEAPLPLSGAKRFFFPPREALLRWSRERTVSPAEPQASAFALFGLRACDLSAIGYQDRFFAGDPWYERRRGQALLIGVNCLAACGGGFCADVHAGPFARAGFDLCLTPLPDGRVFVEIGTAAGEEALAHARVRPASAGAETRATFAALRVRALASFPSRPFVRRAIERLDAGEIAEQEWRSLAPACFTCTGCTSVCPTCSCFTVVDETSDHSGERARVWDSCLLEGFQREASGHHPAARGEDRVRRFWFHKLSRDFADAGRIGCVGCGRCDVTCPGSIGAISVLGALGSR